MNLLTNCGFLDTVSGWTKTTQLTLAVDEATRGAAGRAVLVGTGSTTATNQQQSISTDTAARAVVTAAASYEVAASVLALSAGASVAPVVEVIWYNSGGTQLSVTTLTVVAAQSALQGEAQKGIRNSFRRVRQIVTAPANAARAALRVSVTPAASATAVVLGLLKPQIAPLEPGRSDALTWDPGLHTAADLALPRWPTTFRAFGTDALSEPLPSAAKFQGDAPSRPSMRRTGSSPARTFQGTLRCTPYERAVLDDFWRDTAGDFYFVEPDSDRLCIARFADDGQPRVTEDKGEVSMVRLGLWLETA